MRETNWLVVLSLLVIASCKEDNEEAKRPSQWPSDDGKYPGECAYESDNDLDGDADYRSERTYSDDGYVLSALDDDDGNGSFNRLRTFYYNDKGGLTRVTWDNNRDGIVDTERTAKWDEKALRATWEIEDPDADDLVDSIEVYSYSMDGDDYLLIEAEYDYDANETIDRHTIYVPDDDSNLIRTELDDDADGTIDQMTFYTLDENGWSISSETELADGTVTSRSTYERDSKGNLLSTETDEDADGTSDSGSSYSYDCWE